MRRIILAGFVLVYTITSHGQIIADHTVVNHYDKIPQEYIDEVKKMLVNISGLSHQSGYTNGLVLLQKMHSEFRVYTYYLEIPGYTTNNLRLGKHANVGQDDYYTTQSAIETYKSHIADQNSSGNPYDVMGFAWCWDMHWKNDVGGVKDPVHNVRWAGTSEGGADGDKRWGLDSADSALTGNRVTMDTYLNSVEQYIQHCSVNGYTTKTIFTTGPVDNYFPDVNGTERGFQRELKNDYIRNYVARDNSRILFDYADILCWSNAGEKYMATWDDEGNNRLHANIHPDNEKDYDDSWNIIEGTEDGDHIGEVGALRLAKAMWWLLARLAGWDGTVDGEDTTPPSVPTGLSTGSLSLNTVTLSWNASSDNVAVNNYNIYRNGALVGSTSNLSYTDDTLTECGEYTYTVSALDGAGNESEPSQGLLVLNCQPDLTSTLIVTPNISHGITVFNIIVRITELNKVNSNGAITVNIPADARWDLEEGYNTSLDTMNGIALNNSDWNYSRDQINHIFSSSVVISAGEASTFGFTIVFNPDTSRGLYTVTSQLVPGSGGEIRNSNNADSERLDYFQ